MRDLRCKARLCRHHCHDLVLRSWHANVVRLTALSIVLARLFRRQYRHSEYGRFLIQTERTRDLVTDPRQTAQILDDGADIELRQPGICAPWHDGREDAAVRPNPRLNGGRDLVLGPIAKSRDLVGREI